MIDYRDFVMALSEEDMVETECLLVACLKYMSQSEIKDMVKLNGLDELLEDYREIA